MKLLVEKTANFETICQIEESNPDGGIKTKNYFIQGPFLQSEIKNQNNRLYPCDVLIKEVARYTTAKINDNQAVGELGHPDNPTINLDRASHKIISLKQEGNNFIGKAKILDTPHGKIVKNLMDENVKFGVSSRGLGSLKKDTNGINIVCEDFFLITPADIVSDPSAPEAFVTGIMENKEWAWDNGRLIEQEIEIKKLINTNAKYKRLDEKLMLEIFQQILNKI